MIHHDEDYLVYLFEYNCFGYLTRRGAFVSTVVVDGDPYEILNEDILFVEEYFEKE